MDKQQTQKRIEKLKNLINHHRYLYHVLDTQEISDEALDSLKKELFDLEQQYPELVTPDSPTQRVGGAPLKEFKKIKHQERMLSLNDAFSKEDMEEWLKRISKLLTPKEQQNVDFYCELKIDGLAIELEYEHGVLKTASTRGDGTVGEDITQNIKTVQSIPLSIHNSKFLIYDSTFVVRGEIFLSKKEFNAINKIQKEKGLPLYANPRNVAAGSVRQLDPAITAERRLDSFAYDILGEANINTHEKKHTLLHDLGFKINTHNQYCASLKEVIHFHEQAQKLREKLPYEIDGVVIIVNNNSLYEKLGVVGKTPRGAIAFKFPQNQTTTKVLDIKVQVGRTGAMTPVAILEPVALSGITISRATLHNEDEIKRLGLKMGDTVIVGRAGDVIPNVIKVLPELRVGQEKNFIMPRYCPSCKTKLEKTEGDVVWRCPNEKCFARQRRSFYHFVSKAAFNIEGLGPKIIDRLLDEGLVSDPADLFELQEGDLAGIERFAEKSAENLITSISEKKELPLARFIYALGIRNIGQETAADLALHFGSLEKLKSARLEDFDAIANIGPVVAASVHAWFGQKENIRFLDKLLKHGVVVKNPAKKAGGPLTGRIFIFTGTLESIDRNLAKEKVRDLGGQTTESVSANVDFLVAGLNPGSKLSRAQKLGVKIIHEKEFLDLLT
ncbi:MAG: hypothetical protein A3D44_01695 [Candidatus Staskawiczbacteria bacterium RIFCSPHIGHO2_02_FULL_42_22]|uniref:DNA ligase n=1 Tax=Candidatus Staskawiczbacteria bacterium RIFCSPHIGHO2_02_FULL_42_22 TaxID=1802207 RepID=A0A1G2I0N1_9BACT|nr:MAG: hypothetical protein A3D44_01695 [Candidatus Staskawiczbacteria bacterium RIFCSPHIGHO2_02_FULL_42_22]